VLLLLLLCLGVLDGVVGKVEAAVDERLTPLALWARLTGNEVADDGETVFNDARAELVDTFPDGRPVYASIQTLVNNELNKPIKYLRLKLVELAFENFHIIQFAGNELAGDGQTVFNNAGTKLVDTLQYRVSLAATVPKVNK
jgi:hypothetical protein